MPPCRAVALSTAHPPAKLTVVLLNPLLSVTEIVTGNQTGRAYRQVAQAATQSSATVSCSMHPLCGHRSDPASAHTEHSTDGQRPGEPFCRASCDLGKPQRPWLLKVDEIVTGNQTGQAYRQVAQAATQSSATVSCSMHPWCGHRSDPQSCTHRASNRRTAARGAFLRGLCDLGKPQCPWLLSVAEIVTGN